MSWARYDDTFDDHPKVMAAIDADPCSITLHTCANTYTHRNGLNGFIPREYPRRLLGSKGAKAARALVTAGLWEPCDGGGWRFHDWGDYAAPEKAPTDRPERSERVRRSSVDMAELGRRGGKRSGEARRAKRDARSDEANDASIEANDASTDEAGFASQSEASTLHSFPSGSVKQPEPEPEPASRAEAGDASSEATVASLAGRRSTGTQPASPADTQATGRRPLPPATMTGSELLDEYLDSFPSTPPRKEREWASAAIETHLAEGIDEKRVRTALQLLREDQRAGADVGPGLLAKYIRQAIDGRRPGSARPRAVAGSRPESAAERSARIRAENRARLGMPPLGQPPASQTSLYPIVIDGETA